MSSLSPEKLQAIINRVAKGRVVHAACLYGSTVAGYARPDSDIDLIVVLDGYPYAVKYAYLKEAGTEVSALVVNKKSLEKDAKNAALGEFVVGRLLHIYRPVINPEFFSEIERTYKRRVILEEMQDIVNSAGVLSTEIAFPLEFILFSKIKRRMTLYPGAAYSYYRTYASKDNLEFALAGYKRALDDIVRQDPELLSMRGGMLQISAKRVIVDKGKTRLKLSKRLQEFGSYLVHGYAGTMVMHRAPGEIESKIRRHARQAIQMPDFMSNPKGTYWKLPEGALITDSKDWLSALAGSGGYSISAKRRLGNVNSRTILYVIKQDSQERKLAVKELAKSKAVKWAALSLWTAPVKKFRVDPLLRLGSEYKAARHVRSLGLNAPDIEAVVLDRKLLVTKFVEGKTLAEVIKECLRGRGDIALLRQAGEQIARIHASGSSFGNIKPKNVIVSGSDLYFTDLEQFVFQSGDPAWDLAQFISWGLKGTRNSAMAASIARDFLGGYVSIAGRNNIAKLAKSRRHIESFYPVLAPAVAREIKKEIKNFA
jgi:tRNA A-37 threonylcarbamoyl transferase component Bud32/predicted nucleotidyltransferase